MSLAEVTFDKVHYRKYTKRPIGAVAPQTGHNSNHLIEQLKVLNELQVA
jgi:hypothetical protein